MSLFSCADRQVESALDAAQLLYDAEEYAAADSVLLAIDARGLKPGSRQQSRYDLGDYSQAAHSLFRAMSNADECLEL